MVNRFKRSRTPRTFSDGERERIMQESRANLQPREGEQERLAQKLLTILQPREETRDELLASLPSPEDKNAKWRREAEEAEAALVIKRIAERSIPPLEAKQLEDRLTARMDRLVEFEVGRMRDFVLQVVAESLGEMLGEHRAEMLKEIRDGYRDAFLKISESTELLRREFKAARNGRAQNDETIDIPDFRRVQ
jgi:hypothetical protein